jgi:hypothetical protein
MCGPGPGVTMRTVAVERPGPQGTDALAQLQLHPPAGDDAERRDYSVPSAGRRSGSPSRGNWSSWNVTISVIAPPVTRKTSIVSGR